MKRYVFVALVAAGLLVPAANVVAAQKRPAPTVAHVVTAGETLWSIARRLDPDGDPRAVVGAIMELNRLRTSGLLPGQTLRLPAR